MKKIICLLLLSSMVVLNSLNAQVKIPATFTTTSFKVFGACEQCKDRIEHGLKLKGIKTAVWDVDSKQLSLVYNPAIISLEKIENKIVGLGHDLENKKAKKIIYDALPSCCHYREIDDQKKGIAIDSSLSFHLPTVLPTTDNLATIETVYHLNRTV